MARLSVAVLGAPEVRHGRQHLVFPTRKTLAILLYVLVEGGAQPRDKLAALFWPESDEVAARATLRSTLARLRAGLEGATDGRRLIVDRAVVAFDTTSEFDFDLNELREAYGLARTPAGAERPTAETRETVVARLQQGADLWRGEFLEGFSLRDAPDFDDWASMQREVWRRRMEVVLDHLSHVYADGGASASATETVERWLRLNPLEERAYRRLMRLHLAARDRTAALSAYETCVRVLDQELGVSPDPETLALAERIRAAPFASPTARRPRRSSAVASPNAGPLIGRADEFSTLVERYHVASQGRLQIAVLHGEAGIGKTRLATEFLGWATAQGADVLQGRAFETSARLPYQPLVDALRPRLERETAPAELISSVWLAELSRVLPELRDRNPDLPTPEGDEASARTRLFEALARLVGAFAASAPLVLFIDDVQWADVASLDVLRYAGRRWDQEETAILLLFCLRSEALATSPALEEWLVNLRRESTLRTIDLGPLSFEDTVRLVQSLDVERESGLTVEAFARWIFAETRGQPFYVVETLRALLERDGTAFARDVDETLALDTARVSERARPRTILPASVRQIIQARLAPLSQAARDLLAAAAVLGQGFTFELLCQVGGLAEDEALPALDAVLRGRVLQEIGDTEGQVGDGPYSFSHDKIRDVAYREAGEARRRIFHRRAMYALESAGAPAAELARHALGGRLDDPALRFNIAAGDEAMRVLAARDAAAHFERAIALAERLETRELLPELHARRGRAFVVMGAWTDARRELEAALAGFTSGNPDRYAEVLTDITEAYWWELDVPAVHRHATEALMHANRLGRGDLETKAIAWQAAAEGAMGNLAVCGELIQRAKNRAREAGIAAPTIVGHYHPLTLYWLGRPAEAVTVAREAVSVARERNDVSWLITAFPNLGLALAAVGAYTEATRAFAEARKLGRDYGLDRLLARAIAISTGCHFEVFDFAGAETLAHEARDQARSANFLPAAVSAGIDLLFNSARQGDVGRTEGLVEEVAAAIEETGGFHGWQWRMRLAAARAEIALIREKQEETLHWAEETIAQSRARGRPKYEVLGLTTRADHLLALGHAKAAIADLRSAVALARTVGDPALFVRPAAALLLTDGDDALAAEGRAAVDRIAQALPNEDMRRRFALAEPVRILTSRR